MKEILKLVFSNYMYVVLASVLFTSMLLGLLIISEYIFLDPYVIGYVSPGSEIGFGLIVILSGLSAMVISLNVYRINIFNKSKGKIGTGVFSSFIGTIDWCLQLWAYWFGIYFYIWNSWCYCFCIFNKF